MWFMMKHWKIKATYLLFIKKIKATYLSTQFTHKKKIQLKTLVLLIGFIEVVFLNFVWFKSIVTLLSRVTFCDKPHYLW